MIRTTPFYERTGPLNRTMLWHHWAGHLVADRYQPSDKREYYAVRNGAGLLDTSPLYKYRITGPDAERFLAGVLLRDVRHCRPGAAQYTMWCDDRGFLVEDGVLLRISGDEFLLTSAEPNLAWFTGLAGAEAVEIEDVSHDFGILAIQGPRSAEILGQVAPAVAGLRYFGLTHDKIGDAQVLVSRTGYTGDLGFEVWVERADAVAVWDTLWAAGAGRGLEPFGSVAMHMARIEAGLLLIDVDYRSSRFAWTDEQRASPAELGYGWMARRAAGDRDYVGRAAIERELAAGSSRWRLVGLAVDWRDHQRVHDEAGMPAPEDHRPVEEAMSVYDGDGELAGFSTSFMFSPMLKRHIAMARVPPALARPGTEVALEITIDHRPVTVAATVQRLPFYDPDRRTGRPR